MMGSHRLGNFALEVFDGLHPVLAAPASHPFPPHKESLPERQTGCRAARAPALVRGLRERGTPRTHRRAKMRVAALLLAQAAAVCFAVAPAPEPRRQLQATDCNYDIDGSGEVDVVVRPNTFGRAGAANAATSRGSSLTLQTQLHY